MRPRDVVIVVVDVVVAYRVYLLLRLDRHLHEFRAFCLFLFV